MTILDAWNIGFSAISTLFKFQLRGNNSHGHDSFEKIMVAIILEQFKPLHQQRPHGREATTQRYASVLVSFVLFLNEPELSLPPHEG